MLALDARAASVAACSGGSRCRAEFEVSLTVMLRWVTRSFSETELLGNVNRKDRAGEILEGSADDLFGSQGGAITGLRAAGEHLVAGPDLRQGSRLGVFKPDRTIGVSAEAGSGGGDDLELARPRGDGEHTEAGVDRGHDAAGASFLPILLLGLVLLGDVPGFHEDDAGGDEGPCRVAGGARDEDAIPDSDVGEGCGLGGLEVGAARREPLDAGRGQEGDELLLPGVRGDGETAAIDGLDRTSLRGGTRWGRCLGKEETGVGSGQSEAQSESGEARCLRFDRHDMASPFVLLILPPSSDLRTVRGWAPLVRVGTPFCRRSPGEEDDPGAIKFPVR